MFKVFAVPIIVGFVGFPLEVASILAASVSIFISSSLVSGLLASIPDICWFLRVQDSAVWYLKLSDKPGWHCWAPLGFVGCPSTCDFHFAAGGFVSFSSR
jgi:hypothetical protein